MMRNWWTAVALACSLAAPAFAGRGASLPAIPIRFTLERSGYVTLVIEDAAGRRVRNLIAETPLPAGPHAIGWDGLDDLGRDVDAARHAIYHVPGKVVPPGRYRVRGLVRPKLGLTYEMTPYNEGRPPWRTSSPASEWLANHTPPSAVLFVPAGVAPSRPAGPSPGGQVLVGSFVSEGGSGLAWLNLDGRKLHGQMWIGGVWTGASHLARDAGPRPVEGVYAYTGASWKGDKYNNYRPELRLYELVSAEHKGKRPGDRRFGHGEDRPVLRPNYTLPAPASPKTMSRPGLGGLAVRNGVLVATLPQANRVVFLDTAAHCAIGTAGLDDPRGVAFDAKGRLLVLSGTRLLRFELPASLQSAKADRGPAPSPAGPERSLPAPEVIVKRGLDDPQQLALDDGGEIYVSDRGKSHQVKVFDDDGTARRAIGLPGGPRVGPYDPRRMHNPNGVTIDSKGRLWVAETDHSPKRVSLWTRQGEFVRALYGPPEYGGGGCLDPADKSRFYYAGMALKLDWARGTSEPTTIFYRGDVNPFGAWRSGPPQTPIRRGGKTYLTNCFNSNPTGGAPNAMIWLLRDGVAVPVAAVGRVAHWRRFEALEPFCVRWSGWVVPEHSETYTFYARTRDGSRLWIDDEKVIDNWQNKPHQDQGTAALTAGKRHKLVMVYRHVSGEASAKLEWSSANRRRQTVPAERLFPAEDAGADNNGLTAQYYAGADFDQLKRTRVDPKIDFRWKEVGPLASEPNPFRSRFPKADRPGRVPATFAWSDADDDGLMEPEEVTFHPAEARGITVMGDLTVLTSTALALRPRGLTPGGAPRYDAAKAERLLEGTQRPASSGGDQALLGRDGRLVLTVAPEPFARQSVGGGRGGKADWSYPSLWPGLHASHNAPVPERPGELTGTTRLLGLPVTPRGSDLGPVWAINGNMGSVYLFTMDGLFVATLFADCRRGSWSFPEARRGMPVDEASLGQENFWPSISQTAGGEIYLVARNGSIVRLEGLEQARRLPPVELDVTREQLLAAQAALSAEEARRQKETERRADRPLLVAIRLDPPAVDGELDDWADANWVPVDRRVKQVGDWGHVPVETKAAVAVSAGRLFAAFQVDDPDLLKNSGRSLPNLFKTGGCLDLLIGADPKADPARKQAAAGDRRLLVTRVEGKTAAVLYTPVAPGAKGEPVPFGSPLRTIRFDLVEDVSARVTLAGRTIDDTRRKIKTAAFELSVPLETLGLRPRSGLRIRGDVGILRGRDFQTLHRVYWHNKSAGLVSDLPSEAELRPDLWGTWRFQIEAARSQS